MMKHDGLPNTAAPADQDVHVMAVRGDTEGRTSARRSPVANPGPEVPFCQPASGGRYLAKAGHH